MIALMNGDMTRELDVVALTVDLPQHGLVRGQVGTVVHVHSPDTFEVEFVNDEGRTYGLATLTASQLLPLRYGPLAG
jgi:Domain of unknown function (DUF4926)